MKKLISGLLCAAMIVCLASCANGDSSAENQTSAQKTTETTTQTSTTSQESDKVCDFTTFTLSVPSNWTISGDANSVFSAVATDSTMLGTSISGIKSPGKLDEAAIKANKAAYEAAIKEQWLQLDPNGKIDANEELLKLTLDGKECVGIQMSAQIVGQAMSMLQLYVPVSESESYILTFGATTEQGVDACDAILATLKFK